MNTCGKCKHFARYVQEENGQCWFNPPTVFASGVQMRPNVKTTLRACGRFVELPAEEPQAVREKQANQIRGRK